MALIRRPALFSKQFNIDPTELAKLGIFDPVLNSDTKLFIDPLLLKESKNRIINTNGVRAFEKFFGDIIRLLQHSKSTNDVAWRNAERILTFRELSETCLGYGDGTTHGNAIGRRLRQHVIETAREIIALGIQDPELFALLGLLEENIGADRISDITTRAILPALIQLNEETIRTLKLPTQNFSLHGISTALVRNPFDPANRAVLLVPMDILRELPIAHDWEDVSRAAGENQDLRDRVNQRIGDIWAIRTKRDKKAARDAVLKDKVAFETLMEAVGLCKREPYDPNADVEGHYLWRRLLTEIEARFPRKIDHPKDTSIDELERVVNTIIAAFTDLVENNGQWYHLWEKDKPRHERAAQRFFFAISEVYCKANNLDVSPETDSGGGPVDFKFSSGHAARVLVEIKLSTGRVVHGYSTQLEIYKKAAKTTRGKFVVVDVGGVGEKLDNILAVKNARSLKGEPVSDIFLVDGTRKVSASKR